MFEDVNMGRNVGTACNIIISYVALTRYITSRYSCEATPRTLHVESTADSKYAQ